MTDRILIIEDETGITDFLQQGLSEEGYSVEVEADGRRGLERSLCEDFDLLLVDWMLPSLNGLDICRQYREQNADTPIIMLTARDTVDDTVSGLRSGANDYIRKPFHFTELLERIRVQLRGRHPQKAPVLRVSDIELDPAAYRVTRAGEEILLTQREFDLLAYLIRHKGQVCTRQAIIEEVWDIHFPYDSGIIDVYINALRKKLNLRTDDGCIQTVRGVGYIVDKP